MSQQASPWIRRFAPLIAPGATLVDLACGAGRHAFYFLDRGVHVTAVDIDLSRIAGPAAAAPNKDRLELIEADLEAGPWPLGTRHFDAVVVTNYLWRPILPRIVAAVAPGGLLLYATFGRGNEAHGRPANPDHLAKQGELACLVADGFTVLDELHGLVETPRPAVVSRICARRNAA